MKTINFLKIFLLFYGLNCQASVLDWNNNNTNKYVQNRIQCQEVINSIKWDNLEWPKQNIYKKPPFQTTGHTYSEKKVLESLHMEWTLFNYFGIEFSDFQLQNELNRIIKNSKDKKKLKEYFDHLDNDPVTITECMVRPALVNQTLHKLFHKNKNIHNSVKQQALAGFSVYKNNHSSDIKAHHKNTTRYELSNDPDNKNKLKAKDPNVQFIDASQWHEKSQTFELNKPQFIETDWSFEIKELISQNATSLEIKSIIWHKKSKLEWIKKQPVNNFFMPYVFNNIKLSKIQTQDSEVNYSIGSTPTDYWIENFKPTELVYHTAIWTGNEMIVWGGYNADYIRMGTGWKYDVVLDSWQEISATNAPSARAIHSAVWTGSEMIVWGGRGNEGGLRDLKTGGRYNPVSDTWIELETESSPSGRHLHHAVWTGNDMIVWGGVADNLQFFNDGFKFNPQDNLWTKISDVNAPEIRFFNSVVWTGQEMIIWGGRIGSNLDSGAKYNPVNNTWSPTSLINAPSARSNHVATWTGERMIVWGPGKSGKSYNPVENSWQTIATLNAPDDNNNQTAIWTGTEMVVWGGTSAFSQQTGVYNPQSDTWLTVDSENAPSRRRNHTAIWTGVEMIVWGGEDVGVAENGGKLNLETGSWDPINYEVKPYKRYNHPAIWTGNEMIIWGDNDQNPQIAHGSSYDPMTDQWSDLSTVNQPIPRSRATSIWTGTEMVLWGGYDGENQLSDGARYNPMNDSWLPISSTNEPIARDRHTSIWTGNSMIIWGGYNGSEYLNDGGIYEPSSDSWTSINNEFAPTQRRNHSAIWTGTDMIIWGGSISSTIKNDGAIYNLKNNTWSQLTNDSAPDPRIFHSAVWTGQEMIVWGGSNLNDELNTGAKFNPNKNEWSPLSALNTPTKRFNHSTIWTGQKMIVWGGLVNGVQGATYLNSGGIYDSDADVWLDTSTEFAPLKRMGHSAVWTGEKMIIWGGLTELSSFESLNTMGIYIPNNDPYVELIFSNGFE